MKTRIYATPAVKGLSCIHMHTNNAQIESGHYLAVLCRLTAYFFKAVSYCPRILYPTR